MRFWKIRRSNHTFLFSYYTHRNSCGVYDFLDFMVCIWSTHRTHITNPTETISIFTIICIYTPLLLLARFISGELDSQCTLYGWNITTYLYIVLNGQTMFSVVVDTQDYAMYTSFPVWHSLNASSSIGVVQGGVNNKQKPWPMNLLVGILSMKNGLSTKFSKLMEFCFVKTCKFTHKINTLMVYLWLDLKKFAFHTQ